MGSNSGHLKEPFSTRIGQNYAYTRKVRKFHFWREEEEDMKRSVYISKNSPLISPFVHMSKLLEKVYNKKDGPFQYL